MASQPIDWSRSDNNSQELFPDQVTEFNYVFEHQANQCIPAASFLDWDGICTLPYTQPDANTFNFADDSQSGGFEKHLDDFQSINNFGFSPIFNAGDTRWMSDNFWMNTPPQRGQCYTIYEGWPRSNEIRFAEADPKTIPFNGWSFELDTVAIHENPFNGLLPKTRLASSRTTFIQTLPTLLSNSTGFLKEHLCRWSGCAASKTFDSIDALENHLINVHIATILTDWPGCKWPDCKSRGTFKTSRLLEDHVQNIHIDPLHCIESGCSYKNPFGKQGDLDRHIKSKHRGSNLPHTCPYASCRRTIKQFARKDKLKEHIRNWHGSFECLENDCSRGNGNGFKTEERLLRHSITAHTKSGCPYSHCHSSNTLAARDRDLLEDHIEVMHGEYECGIGSCKDGELSRLIPHTLKVHLCTDHHFDFEIATSVVGRLLKTEQFVLRESHLEVSKGDTMGKEASDCDICKAQEVL